jgi:hypothetical protein
MNFRHQWPFDSGRDRLLRRLVLRRVGWLGRLVGHRLGFRRRVGRNIVIRGIASATEDRSILTQSAHSIVANGKQVRSERALSPDVKN